MLSLRMLIMDEFTLVADALKHLIETNLRVEVITVNDPGSLFAAAEASKPELVLLSVYRPFEDGLEIGRLMKDVQPSARIIVLTTNDDAKMAAECLNHWASAYLHLTTKTNLLEAVRVVIRDGRFLAPEFRRRLAEARSIDERYSVGGVLTARQREVIQQLCAGRTMKEVAANLNIAARTVAFHKYRVMAHFGAKSNADLFHIAVNHHVVEI